MKTELRNKYKYMRKALADKAVKDNSICDNILISDIYLDSNKIFCYYPLADEINTIKIIEDALNKRKRVALPLCTDENGNMNFYYISSLKDDLSAGAFGIYEPIAEKCEKVTDFGNALCIVPGLSFDRRGFRLGYGKGYYDRFLQIFTSVSVGLCYNEFINDCLPHDKYDRQVNYICTEDCFINLQRRI